MTETNKKRFFSFETLRRFIYVIIGIAGILNIIIAGLAIPVFIDFIESRKSTVDFADYSEGINELPSTMSAADSMQLKQGNTVFYAERFRRETCIDAQTAKFVVEVCHDSIVKNDRKDLYWKYIIRKFKGIHNFRITEGASDEVKTVFATNMRIYDYAHLLVDGKRFMVVSAGELGQGSANDNIAAYVYDFSKDHLRKIQYEGFDFSKFAVIDGNGKEQRASAVYSANEEYPLNTSLIQFTRTLPDEYNTNKTQKRIVCIYDPIKEEVNEMFRN